MVRRTTRRSAADGRRIDEKLLIAYLILLVIGLVMVYSTSSILAEGRFGSHLHFFKSQLMWAVLSLIAIYAICRLDLQRLAVYAAPGLFITLILLAVVFVMPAINGSQRWIKLGPMTFQPSELFKFLSIVYLAFSLSNPRRDITRLRQLLYPYAVIIGPGLALVLLEPDLGMAMVTAMAVLGMLYLAGARMKHLATALLPVIGVAAFVVMVLGYKKARVISYLDSVLDPLQGSYQVKQAALTLGSGGLFGAGLGEGRQKLFFLPYPHTDFIFAAIGEEVGMIGLLVLLGLFFYILLRAMRIAYRQPDKFGYLLAAGVTLSLFINVVINIAVVTALIPVTGLPLPFMSYGGSSLLMSSAGIGVLLNLSRRMEEAPA